MGNLTYVYALDLSMNSTGTCVFTNDGRLVYKETIDTHAMKERKLKLERIGTEFIRLIEKFLPSVVVIEQGFTLYNTSTQEIFRVHGLANYIFSQFEQIYYPASTVKKIVTGKGNAKKEVVKEVIEKAYPNIAFDSMDESDAFSVGLAYFIKRGIISEESWRGKLL